MEKHGKILVVDDDYDFVQGVRTILESAGHQVEVAFDGDEGLIKARKTRPDVIVLDVIMPTRDGFSTCAALKGDPSLARIPVLMLTSLSSRLSETSYSITQGLELEADDFIDKPVRPAELLLRISKLLKG